MTDTLDLIHLVERYNLTDHAARCALAKELRKLTINQLYSFSNWVHYHDCCPFRKNRNFTMLWDGLVRYALLYIGAATAAGMGDAKLEHGGGNITTGNYDLYGKTLDQLIDIVPPIVRAKLDATSMFKELKTGQSELSENIAAALKKLKPDLEQPDLLDGIDPETNQKDAITYCARLVDFVWANLPPHKSKTKSLDYVFRGANEGDRLFKDCKAARTYQECYSFAQSSVQTQAAQLHAKRTTSTHKKQTAGNWGDRPERWKDAVEQSRREEEKTIKAERASNRKQKRPRR